MDKIETLKATIIILIIFCIGYITGALMYIQEVHEVENKQVVVQNEL